MNLCHAATSIKSLKELQHFTVSICHTVLNLQIYKFQPHCSENIYKPTTVQRAKQSKMCLSVFDRHLCGRPGEEIEFRQCTQKQEAIEIMKAVYDSSRREPITVEEDQILRQDILECERRFQVWDQIRIAKGCEACASEAKCLGRASAATQCGRKLRANTGRAAGMK